MTISETTSKTFIPISKAIPIEFKLADHICELELRQKQKKIEKMIMKKTSYDGG